MDAGATAPLAPPPSARHCPLPTMQHQNRSLHHQAPMAPLGTKAPPGTIAHMAPPGTMAHMAPPGTKESMAPLCINTFIVPPAHYNTEHNSLDDTCMFTGKYQETIARQSVTNDGGISAETAAVFTSSTTESNSENPYISPFYENLMDPKVSTSVKEHNCFSENKITSLNHKFHSLDPVDADSTTLLDANDSNQYLPKENILTDSNVSSNFSGSRENAQGKERSNSASRKCESRSRSRRKARRTSSSSSSQNSRSRSRSYEPSSSSSSQTSRSRSRSYEPSSSNSSQTSRSPSRSYDCKYSTRFRSHNRYQMSRPRSQRHSSRKRNQELRSRLKSRELKSKSRGNKQQHTSRSRKKLSSSSRKQRNRFSSISRTHRSCSKIQKSRIRSDSSSSSRSSSTDKRSQKRVKNAENCVQKVCTYGVSSIIDKYEARHSRKLQMLNKLKKVRKTPGPKTKNCEGNQGHREGGRQPRKPNVPLKRVGRKVINYIANFCPDCFSPYVLDKFTTVNVAKGDILMKCQSCLLYTCMKGVLPCAGDKHERKDESTDDWTQPEQTREGRPMQDHRSKPSAVCTPNSFLP